MRKQGGKLLRRAIAGMVLAALLGGGLAWKWTGERKPVYKARALLNLAHLPYESTENQPGNIVNLGELIMHVHPMQAGIQDAIAVPDFRLLLTSEDMAVRLRECVEELREKAGLSGPAPSVESIQAAMDVRAKAMVQTMYTVEYQQVLELFFTSDNADVSAGAANFWAELAADMAREGAERERTAGRERYEAQLTDARAKRDKAFDEIAGIDKELPEISGAARLEAFEDALSKARLRRAEMAAQIAKAKAVTEAMGTARGEDAQRASEWLRQQIKARAELAGLEAEDAAGAAETAKLEEEARALRERITDTSIQRRKLEAEVKVQEKRVEDLTLAMETMSLRVAGNMPELAIASRAIPPSAPQPANRAKTAAVAGLLAALFVPFAVFGFSIVRLYADKLETECRATSPGE